jgi:hypothetical protein
MCRQRSGVRVNTRFPCLCAVADTIGREALFVTAGFAVDLSHMQRVDVDPVASVAPSKVGDGSRCYFSFSAARSGFRAVTPAGVPTRIVSFTRTPPSQHFHKSTSARELVNSNDRRVPPV